MLLLRPEDTAGLLTMATLGLEIRPMEHPEPVVRAAEVLIIATNTNVPVLDGAWLSPGAHVTSIVGSNVGLVRSGLIKQKRRELDDTTIRRSDVIVTCSREQVIHDEQGDLFDPVQQGILTWDRVGELGELLNGKWTGRTGEHQITLFKNNAGQGIADVALGAKVCERARAKGVGLELPL